MIRRTPNLAGCEDELGDGEMAVPAKRGDKRKPPCKPRRIQDDSSDEEYSDDEALEKEGNPLERSTEILEPLDEETVFQWCSAPYGSSFPWEVKPSENKRTGLRGMTGKNFSKLTPFGVFSLFLDMGWFCKIAAETTRLGKSVLGDTFEEVKVTEMIVWHALVLGMALHPLINKEMFWQSGHIGTTTFPNYGRFMKRKRWLDIKRFFHLESNAGKEAFPTSSGEHRLWQVQTLIPTLRQNFKKYFCPGGTVTVDERTIPIRNRMCPIRIYNPKKPYKFGMEVFVLCDGVTYYCYDFIVYDKTKRTDLHTNVVLDLAEGLPKHLSFNLVLDRGFTSPILLQKLLKMGHWGNRCKVRKNDCRAAEV